jgi:hypothetical protein
VEELDAMQSMTREIQSNITKLDGFLRRETAWQTLTLRWQGRGGIENEHSTDVESLPPPPCVCMSGRSLRTSTRPTMNVLILLLLLLLLLLLREVLRASTRPTLNRRTESARLYEHSPCR